MNYSNSFNNLYNFIQQKKGEKRIGYLSSKLIRILISFTGILKTCDGRDKLCALIQYTSKFYATILYHAIDLEKSHSDEDPFSKHDALKNVEKSMSSGRKIFRFLKWMEDLKAIYYYIIYKDTSVRNLLKALMSISSFFYHLFDNLVWSSNVGVISEYFVGDIKLKNTKNVFSFLRNLIKLFMDVHKLNSLYIINHKVEEEVYEAFEKPVQDFQHKKLLDQAIIVRSKLRNKMLDIVHSFLRVCMLMYSLKLEPFYSNLHPIFAGFCGMMHSLISIYKCLYDDCDRFGKSLLESKANIKGNMGGLNSNVKPPSLFKKCKKRSLEDIIDELDEKPDFHILDDDYFKNYYVDFNKDFPLHPNDFIFK